MDKILDEIITVLEKSSESDWLNFFKKISNDYKKLKNDEDKAIFKRKMLKIYGGMGSFSDLVVYKNGHVLYLENNKIDVLRKKLFEDIKKSL